MFTGIKIMLDQLENILKELTFLIKKNGYKNNCCLAASTILSYVLTKKGIKNSYIGCSYSGYSKKYLQLLNTVDMDTLNKVQIEQYINDGARFVVVYGNAIESGELKDTADAADGHVIILAEIDDSLYLIDPTSNQFNRNKNDHGYILNAPPFTIVKLKQNKSEFDELINSNHNIDKESLEINIKYTCGGTGSYYFHRLVRIQNIVKNKQSDYYIYSDMNINRPSTKHMFIAKNLLTK